ncbi:MAG: hypothetical protein ACLSE6_08185 [Alphaproteobacteria bacterium]
MLYGAALILPLAMAAANADAFGTAMFTARGSQRRDCQQAGNQAAQPQQR